MGLSSLITIQVSLLGAACWGERWGEGEGWQGRAVGGGQAGLGVDPPGREDWGPLLHQTWVLRISCGPHMRPQPSLEMRARWNRA